jgi:hypothetical protein
MATYFLLVPFTFCVEESSTPMLSFFLAKNWFFALRKITNKLKKITNNLEKSRIKSRNNFETRITKMRKRLVWGDRDLGNGGPHFVP